MCATLPEGYGIEAKKKASVCFQCGAVEGWRSAGPIVLEMKKYHKKSRRRGI
jgi:hypothetical protein